jgi:hypothetical protein
MDVLSLLAAIVAVTVFPGGFYLAAVAGGVAAGGRLPAARGTTWSPPALAAVALLVLTAALVPLPGAPSAVLPLDNGAPANLLAILLLLGGGLALGTAPQWSRTRIAAGLAALAPLLVLAAQAATLDVSVVVGLPGRSLAAARALAAATLLLATPVLARPADTALPRGLRAVAVAVPTLLAAVLLAPPGWSGLPAAVAAALVFGGIAAYAVLAGGLARLLRGAELPLAVAAVLTAIASIALAAVGPR